MDFKFLISLGIGLGVYLVGLGIIALVKRFKKKKVKQEDDEKYRGNNNEEN